MTYGREWTTILFFALPIMGSDLLQALYNLADGVIVGSAVVKQIIDGDIDGGIQLIANMRKALDA